MLYLVALAVRAGASRDVTGAGGHWQAVRSGTAWNPVRRDKLDNNGRSTPTVVVCYKLRESKTVLALRSVASLSADRTWR